MQEIWKDIPNYEGFYQISSFGNVRSLDRVIHFQKGNPKRNTFSKGKRIKNQISNSGYYRTKLCKNQTRKMFSVHRLVAEVFIPNPENKPQVNHIDGNRLNNHVENLEWATMSENVLHAYETGLNYGLRGDLSPHKRAVLQYDKNGNFVKRWSCAAEAARNLNCHRQGIYISCKQKGRICKGYIWKYEDE